MKPRMPSSKPERGSVAVELALILPVMILLIFMGLVLGRLFWHYTVAHKAAQDAARYMSTISAQEMRERLLVADAVSVARSIATEELADLNPGRTDPVVDILCNNATCNGVGSRPLPNTVKVTVQIDFFDTMQYFDFGRYGLPIEAVSEMRYVGN